MSKETDHSNFIISNVSVIDIHTGSKEVKDILVKNERILAIESPGNIISPLQTRVVDATNLFAIPGLWDSHVHMSIWPEYVNLRSKLYVANGVTCVRDMGGKWDDIFALRKHNRQNNVIAPRMWIAGPIIDGTPCVMDGKDGLHEMAVEVDTPFEASNIVDTLVDQNIDFIKPYEMLHPDAFKSLMQRAKHHNLPVAGHIPIRMTVEEVIECGQYDIQHLYGGMASGIHFECVICQDSMPDRTAILEDCTPDETGMNLVYKILDQTDVTADDLDMKKVDELIELYAKKNTWHTPTLTIRMDLRDMGIDPEMKETLRYLPMKRRETMHQMRILGEGATSFRHRINPFGKKWVTIANKMHKSGIKFLAGTEIPGHTAGFSLHLELKTLVYAGLSPLEALQTATLNPAKFFGITDDFGSIEVGRFADMVLLSADPIADINNTTHIASVISRGKYYDRNSIDNLLNEIALECDSLT